MGLGYDIREPPGCLRQLNKTFSNNELPNDVVRTLKEFMAFLAAQGTVDPRVECRKVLHPRPTHTHTLPT